MKTKLLLSILLLISLIGCSDDKPSKPTLAGVTDTGATAIAISADGELVDFVHIPGGSMIQEITFKAPKNGEEITVVTVGPAMHPQLPRGVAISSKVAEGYNGEVTVGVKDGQITGVMGNKVSSINPLEMKHLEQIKKELEAADRKHPDTTVITETDKEQL